MESAIEKNQEDNHRSVAGEMTGGKSYDTDAVKITSYRPEALAQRQILQLAGNRSGTSPIIQRAVNQRSTISELDRIHSPAALVSVDYATMHQDHKDTIVSFLNAAAIQHATAETGFWHQNGAGLLPACTWISKNHSPYIEFNISCGKYNRVVYNALQKTVYLTPHYDGYIRIDNLPDAQVSVLEAIAATNVGYLLQDKSKRINNQTPDAAGKIFALKSLM